MIIQINGKEHTVVESITFLSELLGYYEINQKIIIIELNGEIVQKENYQSTPIQNGDRLEIVHFVGGG